MQRTRDIVLVDQRGTGKSNPLNCRSSGESLRELTESDDASLERLKQCLATLPGDPRLYTTTIAMDDQDDVRAFLGYDKVNLYGGSYGTRAALVYLRRHPEHVRSMVLDGVAPTDMSLPVFAARDAQRSLDKLLADCERDAACRAAYPGLGERVRALFARLERSGRRCGWCTRAPASPRTWRCVRRWWRASSSARCIRRSRRRCCRRSSSAPSTTTSRACWRWPSSAKAPWTT